MTKVCSFCYSPAIDGNWALQQDAVLAADWWQQAEVATGLGQQQDENSAWEPRLVCVSPKQR